jgi:ATP-dependent Clp protease ATP-binding subunit ClpX
MMDAMFEVPSKKVKKFEVTREYAEQQLEKSHMAA